jgi:hypothetical protein
MGVEASAHLIYGIDFGDRVPKGIGEHDSLGDWIDSGDAGRDLVYVKHYFGDKTIVGVKGHLRTSEYEPIEITSLDVNPEAVERFKKKMIEIGIENPQPRWLLTDDVTF